MPSRSFCVSGGGGVLPKDRPVPPHFLAAMVLVDPDKAPDASDPPIVSIQPVYRAGRTSNRLQEEAIAAARIADRDAERCRRDPESTISTSHLEMVKCSIDAPTFRGLVDPQNPHLDVRNILSHVNCMCVASKILCTQGGARPSSKPWPVAYVTAASFSACVINTGCHITDVTTVGTSGIVVELAFCAPGHLIGGVTMSLAEVEKDNNKLMRAALATGENFERGIITQFARLVVMITPAYGPRPVAIRQHEPRSFSQEDVTPLLVLSCTIKLIDKNTKSTPR